MKISFRDYLDALKTKKVNNNQYFVLGNTSVDYDSFFSSILLAYLLTNLTDKFYMPILSCANEDLQLRFQIDFVLNKLKISKDNFHYTDNLTKKTCSQGIFNLVDHNERSEIKNIEYIVDHHGMINPFGRKRIIHVLGSNLTNVFYLFYPSKLYGIPNKTQDIRQYEQRFKAFIKDEPFSFPASQQMQDPEILQIFRYGIMIDSDGFDCKEIHKKWSFLDKNAVNLIQKSIKYELTLSELKKIKSDITKYKTLSFQQTLRKDQKTEVYNKQENNEFSIYYAVIYMSPTEYCEFHKLALEKQFKVKDQKETICIFMAKFHGQKQILVRFRSNISEKFKSDFVKLVEELKYNLLDNKNEWIWFKDPNDHVSRKLLHGHILKNALRLQQ